MTTQLHIDIETYSSEDIQHTGLYRYVQSPDFEILLIAYAINDGPIKIVDLAQGEPWPDELINALNDPLVEKHAHNATFERRCFNQYGFNIPIDQWYCSMIKAAYCGLPLSLDMLSKALKLEEKGKLSTGKALIRYFCNPVTPSKTNGMRMRNFPHHDIDKWNEFKIYCKNDVEAEREVSRILSKYNIPEFERINYLIDQEINDRGVLVDLNLVKNAIEIDNKFTGVVSNELKELTGIENPNSPSQLKEWLSDATGKNIKTLAKDSVLELLDETEDGAVSDVLSGRLKLSKSSTKKYVAMMNCVCDDNRAHGLFQFYGANRTGRWAGRLIQLQNLPQNHMEDLSLAREIISKGDYDSAIMMFDNIPSVLSELIRTALIAPEGYLFAVSDFSAIEARVLSWLAQESWRIDVFKTHGKIYEASAAMMFGVPIESIHKGSELRQRGKTAELALGYQGSERAIEKMDREKKIPPEERKTIVERWRKANPRIVNFWNEVERRAIETIKTGKTYPFRGLKFSYDKENLRICLPSGRDLFYRNPKIVLNYYGKENIQFMGVDQILKQWTLVDTYGGKLVENIVQAVSRDILAYSMQVLRNRGFRIVMHVHDEIIAEVPEDIAKEKLQEMIEVMSTDIPWAPGLPLRADGYITKFYKKD